MQQVHAEHPAGNVAPLLIDRKALAKTLSVSVRSVDRLRSSGTLPPSIRLGGKVLWRTTDIEAFVESGCPRLTR